MSGRRNDQGGRLPALLHPKMSTVQGRRNTQMRHAGNARTDSPAHSVQVCHRAAREAKRPCFGMSRLRGEFQSNIAICGFNTEPNMLLLSPNIYVVFYHTKINSHE